MLDIAKLERRWLKYKIKSFLPYILLVIIIAMLGFTLPLVLSKNSPDAPLASNQQLNVTTKSSLNPQAAKDANSMILEPSMQFLQSMSVPPKSIESVNPVAAPALPAISPKPSAPQPPIETAALPPITKPLLAPVQKGKLTSIKRDDAAFDIHELEERFKNNSNPNLGLYVARYHYDHGNYPESYNYALKTNAINSTIDESWLIFAKSLVKLGKEDQAKKTLQLYISNTNSQNAKNYLDSLSKESSK